MDFQTALNLAGTALVFWAALVGVASVIVHLRVFDRHNPMSVHLLGYMLAIAAVLVLSCIRVITGNSGDSWWFQLLRMLVFIAVPIFMTQRLLLQLRAQRSRPQDTPDEEARP
jgi:FtsH-binding integral membrane protein